MRLLLIAVALLAVPSAQACSLAYQEFTWADLGDDTVVTHLGEDGIRIDLATGRQTTLAQDFFPDLRIDDDGRLVAVGAQKGLGGDCSGERYLRVDGHEEKGLAGYDMDHGRLAFWKDDRITVRTLDSWAVEATYHHPIDSMYPHVEIAIAPDGRIAATTEEQVVVHGPGGKQTIDLEHVDALAWHGDTLVAAVARDEAATFWLVGDTTRSITVETERWGWPQIASGEDLYVAYADTVLRLGVGTQRLVVPPAYDIGAIAADDDGAVILALEASEHGYGDAAGIQRIEEGFTTWHEETGGLWAVRPGPSWRWSQGPAYDGEGGPTFAPRAGEDVPALPFVGALAALALARRMR